MNIRDNIIAINRAWKRSARFILTEWLKIITHMIRSYYRCCCINEPIFFSHCAHLKLGHRFHALLEVCSDRDDIVPLRWVSAIWKLTDNLETIYWTGFLQTSISDCSNPVFIKTMTQLVVHASFPTSSSIQACLFSIIVLTSIICLFVRLLHVCVCYVSAQWFVLVYCKPLHVRTCCVISCYFAKAVCYNFKPLGRDASYTCQYIHVLRAKHGKLICAFELNS